MHLVFLDTEFTDFNNPELISIGLASSDGKVFYGETFYSDLACSEFVRQVVIPLLSRTHQIALEDLGVEIIKWLELIRGDNPIVICYDANYDRDLLQRLFDNKTPDFLLFRSIGYRHINALKRADFYSKNNLYEHHSLNDAMALRHAFRGWTRAVR